MGDTTLAPIVFTAGQDTSSSQLGGAMPVVANAVHDGAGVMRRRPGIVAWDAFPAAKASGSPVIGMAAYGDGILYITADRLIHYVTTAGAVTELSDKATYAWTVLDGGSRPVIVSGRQMLVIAGGGKIQKWAGIGLSDRLGYTDLFQQSPESSFICGVAQRLVALPVGKSGQIWWSGPLEAYENWDMATGGASFIQAAAKPDPLVALADNTNEVFAFGTETLQVFAPTALAVDSNDTNNLLDFAPSRTMNIGCVAPYAVAALDDTFCLIDRQRRIVQTDGRSYNDISRPIFQSLKDSKDISQAWAFRMRFGRFDCMVWMLPADGYGLIWNATDGTWCEWRAWDQGATPVTITSAYNWAEQGLFLVGLSDGSIARLDDTTWTDLGKPIWVELVSGFTNHGSSVQKACNTLMLQFRRTQAAIAAPPDGLSPSGHVRVSCRDREGAWRVVKDVELSASFDPCIQIRSLGVYRTRQWKVEYTGADEIQLVSAVEEFETLGA